MRDGHLLNMQGNRLQQQDRESVQREEIARDQVAARISAAFGLDARLVVQALEVLKRRGELDS
jgi:hypothetical protein